MYCMYVISCVVYCARALFSDYIFVHFDIGFSMNYRHIDAITSVKIIEWKNGEKKMNERVSVFILIVCSQGLSFKSMRLDWCGNLFYIQMINFRTNWNVFDFVSAWTAEIGVSITGSPLIEIETKNKNKYRKQWQQKSH